MANIRPATSADIPDLCILLTLLFTQEAEFVPDHEAQTRGLTRIISDPGIGLILMARQDGQTIGMVNLLFMVSTALGERVALLEDMVVAPAARGAGIGSQLLDVAIQQAQALGCKRITLLTDRVNIKAQRFYQRHGFALSSMMPMRRLLTDA